jgi:glutamyl-Q tRNA(Asp) synthetase
LHTPLVLAANGAKLSKQNGAAALHLPDTRAVLVALNEAAQVLRLPPARVTNVSEALVGWIQAWTNGAGG